MSTTTIRLPKALKASIAAAAERAGTTVHGLILEAIAEKADRMARSADFLDTAERRYANIISSGKSIPWNTMRAYLEERMAGKTPIRPAARKLAR